jgi:hypothetical protein
MSAYPQATSRTGKILNVGDLCSVSGTIVAITGSGANATITIQFSGQTNGPVDPVTGAYTYQMGTPLAGGTNAPAVGFYGQDVTSAQTL